jgi:hypothetical protein
MICSTSTFLPIFYFDCLIGQTSKSENYKKIDCYVVNDPAMRIFNTIKSMFLGDT